MYVKLNNDMSSELQGAFRLQNAHFLDHTCALFILIGDVTAIQKCLFSSFVEYAAKIRVEAMQFQVGPPLVLYML